MLVNVLVIRYSERWGSPWYNRHLFHGGGQRQCYDGMAAYNNSQNSVWTFWGSVSFSNGVGWTRGWVN